MYFAISGSIPRQKAEEHLHCSGLAEFKSKNLKNESQVTYIVSETSLVC